MISVTPPRPEQADEVEEKGLRRSGAGGLKSGALLSEKADSCTGDSWAAAQEVGDFTAPAKLF